MKKQFLTLTIFFTTLSSFAADLYVNGSGLPSSYFTLQAAIDAASDGDNIYMATSESHSGPVLVNKSVYIVSDESGVEFQLVADVIIGNNIDQVTIVGANGISVSSEDNASSRVHLNLISSSLEGLNITHDNYKVNVYDCSVAGTARFKNGVVMGSEFSSIEINNESGVELDTIKIIANEMWDLNFNNAIHNFEIYNNYIKKSGWGRAFSFSSIANTPDSWGVIANNTIEFRTSYSLTTSVGIWFNTSSTSFGSLTIANNYIDNTHSNNSYAFAFANIMVPNTVFLNNRYYSPDFIYNGSGAYLENNINGESSYSSTGSLSTDYIDLGFDEAQFYDIDGTINDIGTSGGPHAWSQYHTSGGKAVIYDLEIPAQLYLGVSQSVKATGIHKN